MYAFVRVIDPNTQLPKYVLINWVHDIMWLSCDMLLHVDRWEKEYLRLEKVYVLDMLMMLLDSWG